MKKVLVFAIMLFVLSCNHDESLDLKVQNELVCRDNPFSISETSSRFGLESVSSDVTSQGVRIITSSRPIVMNGVSFNEFAESFVLSYTKDGSKRLSNDNNSEFVINELEAYYNGELLSDTYLESLSQLEVNRIIAMLVLYEELTNKEIRRSDRRNRSAVNGEECGFAASSIRFTRSYAEYRAAAFAEKFLDEHDDCKAIGEQDTSCLFGSDHYCISSIAIVCDGATCN